jgi:branched-subunit amino acid transport protein
MNLSTLEFVVMLAGLVLVVTGTRVVFLYLPANWRPRGNIERALRYAPLAALVALAVPQVFLSVLAPAGAPPDVAGIPETAGWLSAMWVDGRVPAAAVLLVVGAWTRQPLAGLAAGVAVLMLV